MFKSLRELDLRYNMFKSINSIIIPLKSIINLKSLWISINNSWEEKELIINLTRINIILIELETLNGISLIPLNEECDNKDPSLLITENDLFGFQSVNEDLINLRVYTDFEKSKKFDEFDKVLEETISKIKCLLVENDEETIVTSLLKIKMDLLNKCISTLYDTLLVNESEYYDPIKFLCDEYAELGRSYQLLINEKSNYWKKKYYQLKEKNENEKLLSYKQSKISPYSICPDCLEEGYKKVKSQIINDTIKIQQQSNNNIKLCQEIAKQNAINLYNSFN